MYYSYEYYVVDSSIHKTCCDHRTFFQIRTILVIFYVGSFSEFFKIVITNVLRCCFRLRYVI